jgi:adenosylcobinamide kinase / adenosylcobinamide-phosphate guanylyltransferase
MPLTFLVGGARSGKSRLAVELAATWGGPVAVVATAEAEDQEMLERIERHRRSRPAVWETVEEPVEVERVLSSAPSDACVLVEDLTLWISNLLLGGLRDEEILRRSEAAAATAASRAAPSIAVSNEVGSGIVPMTALGRRFQDLLGGVNAAWVDAADRAGLMVAGRVLWLPAPIAGEGDGS